MLLTITQVTGSKQNLNSIKPSVERLEVFFCVVLDSPVYICRINKYNMISKGKISILLLAVFTAMLLVGCKDSHVSYSLVLAEQFMQNKPDSSLTILEKINKEQLSSAKEQALYALLLTQAEDKNSIEKTNDSLISIAADYYANTKEHYHKMLAHYYKAKINYNAKNYSNSIISLFKAEDAAKELEDYFQLGLIYQRFSDIYQKIYNNIEHLNYAQKAYDCFVASKNVIYKDWALYDLARAYHNLEDYDNSLINSRQVIDIAYKRNNKSLLLSGLKIAGASSVAIADYKAAKNYYNSAIEIDKGSLSASDYCNLGIAHLSLNEMDKAVAYMKVLDSIDSEKQWLKYEVNRHKKNYKEALEAFRNEYMLQNSVIKNLITQNVTKAVSDYNIYEQTIKEKELKREKTSKYIYILGAMLILAILCYHFWQYSKEQKMQIRNSILLASNLKNELETKDTEISEMNTAINSLFSEQFKAIDELIKTYYEDCSKDKRKTIKSFENIISEMQISSRSKRNTTDRNIEEIINKYKDNLISKLKMEFPSLKEDEIMVYVYLVAGFSPQAISIFINCDVDDVYRKKYNLRSKISRSSVQNRELFLSEIA